MIEGITTSERYLNNLGKRSFLSLWSYPNLYRAKGKELTDLLIVCENFVIIISDKSVKFDIDVDLSIAWQRWYNRCVLHSSRQLLRAKSWIINYPSQIFKDARCEMPLHVLKDVRKPIEIHLVAVANGASHACLRHYGKGSGSIQVSPRQDAERPDKFSIGNPGSDKHFVHVLDEANLNVVLQELDTITDFVEYLRARENVFRNVSLVYAASEEDLLAIYLRDVNSSGKHDFVSETGVEFKKDEHFAVEEGSYLKYTSAPEYKRKKIANKISYIWDGLIENFSKHFMEGSLAPVPEYMSHLDGRFGGAEIGLRQMALQDRVTRRAHSKAIKGAFDRIEETRADRYFRAMVPQSQNEIDSTAFFILLLRRFSKFKNADYEVYREYRAALSQVYAEVLLEKNRNFSRVVGIAM